MDETCNNYVAATLESYVFVASRCDQGRGAAPVSLGLL
jgi:hypothetical protein